MDESNYLGRCEQNEYEEYMSLALSTSDEELQHALEEASVDED